MVVPERKLEQFIFEFLSDPEVFDRWSSRLTRIEAGDWSNTDSEVAAEATAAARPKTPSQLSSPPVARASPSSGNNGSAAGASPNSPVAGQPLSRRIMTGPANGGGGAGGPRAPRRSTDLVSPRAHKRFSIPGDAHSFVPPFYHKPHRGSLSEADAHLLDELRDVFDGPHTELVLDDLEAICRVLGVCIYFAADLAAACRRFSGAQSITPHILDGFWRSLASQHHSESEKMVALLVYANDDDCPHVDTTTRAITGFIKAVEPKHWRRFMQNVIDRHPGLEFLIDSPDYHERYIDTAIARIYYLADRNWSRILTARQIERSPLCAILESLEEEFNINKEQRVFSYEHFYVIYTSFWKLDKDHDLSISQRELALYGDGGLSSLVLDRIFSGTVFSADSTDEDMAYWDFVYFVLSEEDKTSAQAAEYWFRIMDLDGDGCLSMFELEMFYDEQLNRLDELGTEAMNFNDMLCQILDMINPRSPTIIRLMDIKRSGKAKTFFNTFINVNKYLYMEENEASDDEEKITDWVRFAQREYIFLSSEDPDDDDDLDMDATLDRLSTRSPLLLY
ncbi:uncharacterized protein MONBRDRAFT_10318 [Monosiga brevicollis MX1]|uniref:EF-hand domain-containing protein n=1 Tax=Monosiga brevicollis TaxID=81824 RepID=A9V5V5_MONBE|nr:uncharacterized protein MONBRDRAFT_10318 [Monosiga brevicollis MX1]EDQ87179.1 predicted protein [Monosiga brevicollis MX1]|eukprot:XP_001748122.1 hypothetical protein [Monosiga brevicollis MX1]